MPASFRSSSGVPDVIHIFMAVLALLLGFSVVLPLCDPAHAGGDRSYRSTIWPGSAPRTMRFKPSRSRNPNRFPGSSSVATTTPSGGESFQSASAWSQRPPVPGATRRRQTILPSLARSFRSLGANDWACGKHLPGRNPLQFTPLLHPRNQERRYRNPAPPRRDASLASCHPGRAHHTSFRTAPRSLLRNFRQRLTRLSPFRPGAHWVLTAHSAALPRRQWLVYPHFCVRKGRRAKRRSGIVVTLSTSQQFYGWNLLADAHIEPVGPGLPHGWTSRSIRC